MRVTRYIRRHHVGLIALTGTAYAGTQVANLPSNPLAATAKKKVKRGPAGPQGPQGLQGLPGQNGSSAASAMFSEFTVSGSATGCGRVSDVTATQDDCSASTNTEEVTPAAAVTARDMSVSVVGAIQGSVVTLQRNNTDTALTCTTDVAGKCQDTTHTVTIPAGSLLRFQASNPGGVGLIVRVGWRATG